MWPLGKKRQLMTTDAAVSVLADEIRAGMEPYTIALDRFAVTRDNDSELGQLLGELWIFQLTRIQLASATGGLMPKNT